MANLQIAFNSFHARRCQDFGIPNSPSSFKNAMRELEGTFINLRTISNGAVVEFSNPSIRDYMQNLLLEEDSLRSMIESTVFFDQVDWMNSTLNDKNTLLPLGELSKHQELIINRMIFLYEERIKEELIRYDYKYNDRFALAEPNLAERLSDIALWNYARGDSNIKEFVIEKMSQLAEEISRKSVSINDCIIAIGRMHQMELLTEDGGREIMNALKKVSTESNGELQGYEDILRVQEEIPTAFTESEMIGIGCEFDRFAERYFDELMDADMTDPEEIREAADRFGKVGIFFSVDTTETVQSIKDVADQKEQESDRGGNWDPDGERQGGSDVDHFSNGEMDSMFRTLGD